MRGTLLPYRRHNEADNMTVNADNQTIAGFGDEWERFDQSDLTAQESLEIFDQYFSVFPWDGLPDNPNGFDLGCGSGRWAVHVAPKIGAGTLHCIDPSAALEVARKNLSTHTNCTFHAEGVSDMSIPNGSMDFGYSLGVLHHIPDTAAGIKECVAKLKPGAPFLVYLYYAFDNRPSWFRTIWKMSDVARRVVSKLPHPARYVVSQVIAFGVYLPLARTAGLLEKLGRNVDSFPLSAYRKRSIYVLRTDALDRFGTALERRLTRTEIQQMMITAGLERITFRTEDTPFWCAVGYRSR
jgi:ubiquinone/menaquinone biosynthesis C-methylase UbiE